MRLAAKVDANHAAIVHELRKRGALVESLAAVGKGVPDILVGWKNQFVLFEIKDGNKCPSARKLTPAQEAWHRQWAGYLVFVVTSPANAIVTLGEIE